MTVSATNSSSPTSLLATPSSVLATSRAAQSAPASAPFAPSCGPANPTSPQQSMLLRSLAPPTPAPISQSEVWKAINSTVLYNWDIEAVTPTVRALVHLPSQQAHDAFYFVFGLVGRLSSKVDGKTIRCMLTVAQTVKPQDYAPFKQALTEIVAAGHNHFYDTSQFKGSAAAALATVNVDERAAFAKQAAELVTLFGRGHAEAQAISWQAATEALAQLATLDAGAREVTMQAVRQIHAKLQVELPEAAGNANDIAITQVMRYSDCAELVGRPDCWVATAQVWPDASAAHSIALAQSLAAGAKTTVDLPSLMVLISALFAKVTVPDGRIMASWYFAREIAVGNRQKFVQECPPLTSANEQDVTDFTARILYLHATLA